MQTGIHPLLNFPYIGYGKKNARKDTTAYATRGLLFFSFKLDTNVTINR